MLIDRFPVGALIGAVIILMHTLGVVAAFHAIRYARTSQGAVAWTVSLIWMPYFTLIPYLFLGSSRFFGYVSARRLKDLQIRSHTQTAAWASTCTTLNQYDKLIYRLGQQATCALTKLAGMSFTSGNQVSLLKNGITTFSAILAAIEHASNYVMVQFFVVRDDELGRQLQQALLAKVATGVRVYFLYDSIGCSDLPRHYVDILRTGGIAVHRFATQRFVNRFQLNFRNHRKIVVIDGQQAFVGGHNVGDEYLGKKPPLSPWRDTHIEITGPAVAGIQLAFMQDWFWATQYLPPIKLPQPRPNADMHCLVIASSPADPQETCSLFFVEAIHLASERIWIASPYFIPDEAVFAALRLAVMRGVDVRILLPSRPDHYVVFHASMLYVHDALRAGVKVFRYRPGFLHQKVLLIDNSTAAIGSANLDNRSFRLNFEIIVLTVNDAFAAEVEAMLTEDFAQADAVKLTEVTSACAWRRAVMHIARLFSPLL